MRDYSILCYQLVYSYSRVLVTRASGGFLSSLRHVFLIRAHCSTCTDSDVTYSIVYKSHITKHGLRTGDY